MWPGGSGSSPGPVISSANVGAERLITPLQTLYAVYRSVYRRDKHEACSSSAERAEDESRLDRAPYPASHCSLEDTNLRRESAGEMDAQQKIYLSTGSPIPQS
ncbi:Uncharacterized protein DAT39_007376 [Clarias magur]|uniref:Uncharacterized protein n=1 Tax=Clarias magur TaxID=1594786 RepID=A0A8J4U8T4_CLAMG|nr:Uncharacterized protein DAT39_007376 [Clarias magur]